MRLRTETRRSEQLIRIQLMERSFGMVFFEKWALYVYASAQATYSLSNADEFHMGVHCILK